jgi:hypothetical protein
MTRFLHSLKPEDQERVEKAKKDFTSFSGVPTEKAPIVVIE